MNAESMLKILSVLIFSFPLFAQADPFGFVQTRLGLYDETSYLLTNSNFDSNGNIFTIGNGYQLQEIKTQAGGTYDITDFFGVHADVNFKQVQTQGPGYNFTTSGIGEAAFGAGLQLFDVAGFKLIPDITLVTNLAPLPGATAAAFITDGAFVVQGLAYLAKKFWITDMSFYAGYKWRSQGLSSQIPVGIISRTEFGKYIFLFLKVYGEFTTSNDQYTSTPSVRATPILLFNGGSTIYDSINPQFFYVQAKLGWNISRDFDLAVGVNQTITGARTNLESRAMVTLAFSHILEARSKNSEPALSHKRSRDAKPVRNQDPDKFEVDSGNE